MPFGEGIRKWEYINLADLLGEHIPDHLINISNGQMIAVSSTGSTKKLIAISDSLSWLQAFNILTAILVSSESTTKEGAAGLTAHSHLIIQLSKGSVWPSVAKI